MLLLWNYFFQLSAIFVLFLFFLFSCTWYCWKKYISFEKTFSSISCICITKLKNLHSDFVFWNIPVEVLLFTLSYLSALNFIIFASGWFIFYTYYFLEVVSKNEYWIFYSKYRLRSFELDPPSSLQSKSCWHRYSSKTSCLKGPRSTVRSATRKMIHWTFMKTISYVLDMHACKKTIDFPVFDFWTLKIVYVRLFVRSNIFFLKKIKKWMSTCGDIVWRGQQSHVAVRRQ